MLLLVVLMGNNDIYKLNLSNNDISKILMKEY